MKFRKKPVVVEAHQITPDTIDEVMVWCGGERPPLNEDERVNWVAIDTLEGVMIARMGDWVIRGVQGEFYPCKPDIFDATYEAISEP